jgi:hypothetical protein
VPPRFGVSAATADAATAVAIPTTSVQYRQLLIIASSPTGLLPAA